MLSWPQKDPDEVLDYEIDWKSTTPPGPRLEEGETIVTSTPVVASGSVVIDDDSEADGVVTVWLSGGTAGEKCVITSRIETSSTPPRIYDKSVLLRIGTN